MGVASLTIRAGGKTPIVVLLKFLELVIWQSKAFFQIFRIAVELP